MIRVLLFVLRPVLMSCACFIAVINVSRAAESLELDCFIQPEMVIELSSPVDGIVANVAVDKSDKVVVGQELARLESSVEQTQVNLARLRAEMDENIKAKQIQRDLTAQKKKRVVELYRTKSVPLFEKDDAEAEASLAELELIRAKNDKKLAELDLDRALADLNLRTLSSPIDGVVMDRYVHPGESVKDRPLLKLAKVDPMRVEIIAPSHLFGQFQPGMELDVTTEWPTQSHYRAIVSVVDSVVDAASGSFGVRLKLPNADNSVVGGVKCKAGVSLSE
ncbi:MAG: efflux RND transporter periplasmic adaptor subunit [Halieaceae bacterium]